MTVYLWEIPDDYPEDCIGEYDRKKGPDRFLFKRGSPIAGDLGSPRFRFTAAKEILATFDDLPNNAMVPLISQRLVQLLQQICPGDAEFFPAAVLAAGEELNGFSVLNVVNKVTGIDHEASEYTLIPGTNAIMGFRKLRYRPGCLGAFDLARDEEYLSNLLVSQRLRDAITAAGMHGVGLYAPDEMSW